MDKFKQDAHIIFAMAEDGSLRQIRDVANGVACNCFCIACRMPVIARQGAVRQWHFAHSSQQGMSCEWAAETALHFAMKQLIDEERQIFIPEMHVQVERTTSWGQTIKRTHSIPGKMVQLESVALEHSVHPIRPDVVAMSGGKRLFIEVTVTHGTDQKKLKHIQAINTSAIEFNLRDYSRMIDWEMLRALLVSASPLKSWIFNRRQAEIEAKLLDEVMAEIAKLEEDRGMNPSEKIILNSATSSADQITDNSNTDWLTNSKKDVVELTGKMKIRGKAICFSLKNGGEVFVHSIDENIVLLHITEQAEWLLSALSKFSVGKKSDSEIWVMPKNREHQLFIYLNSISSATRSVQGHTF